MRLTSKHFKFKLEFQTFYACYVTLTGVRVGWRGGGGGQRGNSCSPQCQKYLKFFGQNADDSGKSTREKTLKGSQGPGL